MKLKHCHGTSEQIPEDMWGLAKSYELYLEGKISLKLHNSYIATDNVNRIKEYKDRKWLNGFFIWLKFVLVSSFVLLICYYISEVDYERYKNKNKSETSGQNKNTRKVLQESKGRN